MLKLRRPQLQLMYVLVPDSELQTAYDVLSHIRDAGICDFHELKLAVSTFLSLTESLVEQYSPPYEGGHEWDNRRKVK